jgi:glutamyl-tRNA reductase
VPRNIEPAAGQLSDVFLYGVDDLRHVAEQGINARQQAAIAAEASIDGHVQAFMSWLHARERFEPILALRERSFAQRDHAVALAMKRLDAGQEPAQIIAQLAHQLTNAMLHAPTTALREAAAQGDDALLQHALKLMRLN